MPLGVVDEKKGAVNVSIMAAFKSRYDSDFQLVCSEMGIDGSGEQLPVL
jgi:hypothetical protein